MQDTAGGEFLLTAKTYWEFIRFWQEHCNDLAEAVLTIASQCPDVWCDPGTIAMPEVDLDKLRGFLENAISQVVTDRLLIYREEAAADTELCQAVVSRLREITTALPPPNLGPVTRGTRSSPASARFWIKPEGEAAEGIPAT